MIYIGQKFFLLDFELNFIHRSKLILEKTDGIREHQYHSNYKANQTSSSLP
jgi:hypothetical protein